MTSDPEPAPLPATGQGSPPALTQHQLSVYLAEYAALREEIKWLNQEAGQYQNFAIGLLSFVAAVAGFAVKSKVSLLPLLLAVPVPFSVLGLLFVRQRVEVQVVADYIERKLRDRVRQLVDDNEIWTWEEFKRQGQTPGPGRFGFLSQEKGILFQRALLFVLPSLVAITLGLLIAFDPSLREFAGYGAPLWILFAMILLIDILLALWLIVVVVRVSL